MTQMNNQKHGGAGEEAAALLVQLNKITPEAIDNDPNERYRAAELSKKLTATLEGPVNRATELVFKPFLSIAARIAVGMNLFEPIVSHGKPISSAELAKITGAEEALISRILRLLVAIDYVEQTGPYEWSANATTEAMATPGIAAGHQFVYDALVSSAIKAPKFLSETKWTAPTEPHDGFIQYANQTKLNVFDFLQSQPPLFRAFNTFMGNTMGAREYWWDWYDVQGRLLDGLDKSKNEALLVDVAGGKGHDLQAFYEKFGDKGELVLQEMPAVIEGIKEGELHPSIKKTVYDFFTPQPIKGARAYFFHHILHDWSDKCCHLLLKQLRSAMEPGYSKLLIHDLVLPDVGATEIQARFDLTMMTFNAGMERSEREWTKLLEDTGFKVTGVWKFPDRDGIVEAEIAG